MSRMMEKAGMSVEEIAIVGGIAALIYLIYNHGIKGAAEKITEGAVNAVTGAASGAVSAVGETVGIPGYSQVASDPRIVRWILDAPNGGYAQASFYATPTALFQASQLPRGSGIPAPPGTDIARLFPTSAKPTLTPDSSGVYSSPDDYSVYQGPM